MAHKGMFDLTKKVFGTGLDFVRDAVNVEGSGKLASDLTTVVTGQSPRGNVRGFAKGVRRLPFIPDQATDESKSKPTAIEKFRAINGRLPAVVSSLAPILDKEGKQVGLGGLPAMTKKKGLPGTTKKAKAKRPVFTSGLPTSGLPTFAQLGGELGRISKFIGDTSKFNASRGLPAKKRKLDKTKITALTKLHESALLTNPERAKQLEDLIVAELGLDFGVDADLDAIENF